MKELNRHERERERLLKLQWVLFDVIQVGDVYTAGRSNHITGRTVSGVK